MEKAAKIHDAMSDWLSPPFAPALMMIVTGADAANRNATKAFVSSATGR